MIGQSPVFQQSLRLIERVARFDASVLILGETGTGKELAARAIHYGGARRERPFVPVNCGAIPDALVENELFGHDRGAFTGAGERREGLIACAHGGTLFLDEIDALSPKAQVTLLRFLQDQQYRPLGGSRERQGDVRILSASNSDLRECCARKAFRIDLFYRLSLLEVALPPLREREGDAALLATHFAARLTERYFGTPRRIRDRDMDWFARYAWPGNVRELENVVSRAVMLSDGEEVRIAPPPGLALGAPALVSYTRAKAQALQDFERRYLAHVLTQARGNVTLAAQLAGKERRAFGKLIKKHAIDRNTYRAGV